MKIIEEEVKEFRLVYDDGNGYGYSFPCDVTGNILWDKISCPAAAKNNLAVAKTHPEKWSKYGAVETLIRHERYGICPYCGRRVALHGEGYFGAFDCECGKWYNRFGQELIPPKRWFEDRDDGWYEDLYNDWKDDSYKYRYEDGYKD